MSRRKLESIAKKLAEKIEALEYEQGGGPIAAYERDGRIGGLQEALRIVEMAL